MPTGIGAFCEGALATLARRQGIEVRAFAVSWRRRRGIEARVPRGVVVLQRAMPARPLHALWRRADFPDLEWFIGGVDVVHGTNFVVPPTRRAGAVASVHDLTPLRHPDLCDAATLAYPALIRRALDRGAWVHTDSAFVAAEVEEAFGAEPGRVRVVHPGIPLLPRPTSDEVAAARTRLLPPETGPYCMAIGTAEPRKDLPGLVRAFGDVATRLREVSLVLVGPPGWGEEELAAAVHSSPVRSRIVRCGWLDPSDLAALLHGASVLAYPSLYEGFGFPPLQAMEAGVPVVATRAGSLPEILDDAAVLVPARDPEALAGALEECVSDDQLRRRLVDSGRTRAAQFSWERCGEGLERLYRDVAGDHGE